MMEPSIEPLAVCRRKNRNTVAGVIIHYLLQRLIRHRNRSSRPGTFDLLRRSDLMKAGRNQSASGHLPVCRHRISYMERYRIKPLVAFQRWTALDYAAQGEKRARVD